MYRQLLREPLLHFLLIGSLLWSLQGLLTPLLEPRPAIHVSAATQQVLFDAWTRDVGKPPTAQQRQALIDQQIDDEILIAEALRIGIDRHDRVVRERLLANQEFVAGEPETVALSFEAKQQLIDAAYAMGMPTRDLVVRRRLILVMKQLIESRVTVTQDELRQWFDANPERFTIDDRVDVQQLFFGNGAAGNTAAQTALEKLLAGSDVSEIVRLPFLLGENLAGQDRDRLEDRFGKPFADLALNADIDLWQPIETGYGWHLVKVTARTDSHVPAFDIIQRQATAALYADKDAAAVSEYLAKMREKYDVSIEAIRMAAAS